MIPSRQRAIVARCRNALFAGALAAGLSAMQPLTAWAQPAGFTAPAAPRFAIQRIVADGNTLIPQAEVEALLRPFTGPDRDFGDVQRALEALQERYADLGYSAVRVLVPEQNLAGGTVRLQVVEARIRQVRIEGARFFDVPNIRRTLPGLQEGTSPNSRVISQQVGTANENPIRQQGVVLESTDEPGRVDALVRVVDDRPWRFNTFLDNSGNGQTGYQRLGFGFQHANVANLDHVFNIQYITSPSHLSDVAILGAGYRIPLYRQSTLIDVFAGYSDVNSGTVQNLFTVSGSGRIFGLRLTHILPKLDTYEHRVTLGLDYRAFRTNLQFIGVGVPLIPDITIKPMTLGYGGRWLQQGRDVSFNLSYSQNLPSGADGDQNAFLLQRAQARAGYQIWRASAAWAEALPADLLLRVSANGQYTRDRLVSGEQFGMGGQDSVRGFLERETANDIGMRGSVELYTPDFGSRIGEGWRLRGLAFVDVARGNDRLPVRGPDNGLASAGLGVRLAQLKGLAVRADWARVMDAGGARPEGKDRVHFTLAYTF